VNTLTLKLSNFQVYDKAQLSFTSGITVIRGANSSGKSAVFRAVEALVTNPLSGKDYIHHDKTKCSVSLNFDSNFEVIWTRSTKGVSYKINDKSYTKLGRDNVYTIFPEFPLTLDDRGNLANLHGEWDLMFPFDRSEGDLFRLFEDVFQISESNRVLKEFQQQGKKFQKELQENHHKQALTEERVNGINEILSDYNITQLSVITQGYEESKSRYEELQKDIKKALAIQECIELIEELEEFPIGNLSDMLSKLNSFTNDLDILRLWTSLTEANFEPFKYNPEQLQKGIELKNDIDYVQEQGKKLLKAHKEGIWASKELKQRIELIEKVDICPLCKQSMEVKRAN